MDHFIQAQQANRSCLTVNTDSTLTPQLPTAYNSYGPNENTTVNTTYD
jgi:hypothetical protein